jgi:hypothetical protein
MTDRDREAKRRAELAAKATTAANAKVQSRYALAKLKAEQKHRPRLAPAKVSRHEPR